MDLIVDLDNPASWPDGVIPLINGAVARLEGDDWMEYPYDYLGWTHFEAEERALRDRLGDDRLVGYHATRLLPQEVENIRGGAGLEVLSESLRQRKVTDAKTHFPEAFGDDDPDGGILLRSGPSDWQGTKEVRMNFLRFGAPYSMFDHHARGVMNLLDTWGGETLGWLVGGRHSSILSQRLTQVSTPTIVEIAVKVSTLNLRELLPAFAGRLYEVPGDYSGEWSTTESIPSEFVLDIITPSSARWPDPLDEYRSSDPPN